MQNLKVTIVQSDLVWEDAQANLAHFSEKFDQIDETDLIVLPETFNTGFSMNSKELAEPMMGISMRWMAKQAKEKDAVVCGSLIIEEAGSIYNRFVWMQPDGSFKKYDKRHLFRMGEENQYFTGGEQKLIVELKGWKLCPMICYDLRFPIWSRNKEQYDALLYVANWPEARITAWEKLLYARAIENQCYVVAANRIGVDGNGVNCIGNSMAIDSKGELMWKAQNQSEEIKTVALSYNELSDFRKKFPVNEDADDFKIL